MWLNEPYFKMAENILIQFLSLQMTKRINSFELDNNRINEPLKKIKSEKLTKCEWNIKQMLSKKKTC